MQKILCFYDFMQVQIIDQLRANEVRVFQLGSLLNRFHHASDFILELARHKCSAKIVKRIFSQSTCSIHLPSELNNFLMQCIPESLFKLLQDAARDEDTRSVRNKKEICPILALR